MSTPVTLQNKIYLLEDRIKKMYAGSLSPESRLNGYKVVVGELQKRITEQEARIKELGEALKKYGHHSRLCKAMQINRNLKCDCGLEQALKDRK